MDFLFHDLNLYTFIFGNLLEQWKMRISANSVLHQRSRYLLYICCVSCGCKFGLCQNLWSEIYPLCNTICIKNVIGWTNFGLAHKKMHFVSILINFYSKFDIVFQICTDISDRKTRIQVVHFTFEFIATTKSFSLKIWNSRLNDRLQTQTSSPNWCSIKMVIFKQATITYVLSVCRTL